MKPYLLLAAAAAAAVALPASAQQTPPVPPVRMSQVGLLPDGPKRAIVPNAATRPLPWRLVDAGGRTLAQGETRVHGRDAASGEHVHVADFSGFTGTGDGFRLIVGDAESRPFRIAPGLYDRLPFDALAYFYHNRAGTPIEARYAGGARWARPAGHPNERATCFSGTDERGVRWPGCGYTLDVTGGWYDAGDHGKYVVNGGIALWTLQNAAERQRLLRRPDLFRDGSATIPEAGNRVSDLLDEARWEMEFFLRMQVPDGQRIRVPVGVKQAASRYTFTEIDASGMAHHKVADETWTGLPLAPHQDDRRRFLYPPSTAATLNLAATAAQCARLWREIDRAFAGRCLAAAERAFAAARRNPEVWALSNFTGSGGYGDSDLSDEFYWAAAELYAATGRRDYEQAVRASPHFAAAEASEPGWPRVAALGTITLALTERLPAADRERLRGQLVTAADGFVQDLAREGYRIPFSSASGYAWGSTSNLLNRAIILALAHDFTGDRHYRDAVIDGMDYLLGRNPLNRSYISGWGTRPMRAPHHRFWAESLDPNFPPPPPGALSGGPNNTSMSDDVARPMRGACAPMTCWVDNAHAFSLNEVAVNWNAPLVWVSAWVAEQD
jgi:endoglucanase